MTEQAPRRRRKTGRPRKGPGQKAMPVGIRLLPEVAEKLRQLAADAGVSQSELITSMLMRPKASPYVPADVPNLKLRRPIGKAIIRVATTTRVVECLREICRRYRGVAPSQIVAGLIQAQAEAMGFIGPPPGYAPLGADELDEPYGDPPRT